MKSLQMSICFSHRHKWPALPVLWTLLQWLLVLRGAIFIAHRFHSLLCTETLPLQYLVEPQHLITRPQAWDPSHSNSSKQLQQPPLPPPLPLRQCHLGLHHKLCTLLRGRLQLLHKYSCLRKCSLQFQSPLQQSSSNLCHSRAQLHLCRPQQHRCSPHTPRHL